MNKSGVKHTTQGLSFVAAAAVLVSVAMLGFAIPRAIAALTLLPADPSLGAMRRGKPLNPTRLRHIIATRREAAQWVNNGQVWADLAFAELELAASGSDRRQPSGPSLQRVSIDLRRALSLKPINPDSWRWLAAARLSAGDLRNAAAALRMSLFCGPHVTYLAIPRVRLALILWGRLGPDDRGLVYRQIRFAWARSPDRLVALAAQAPDTSPIRTALASVPEDLVTFEKRLKAFKPK